MEMGKQVQHDLEKKKEILERLAQNTKLQSHFIQGRKMKGLERLLTERDVLLSELETVNERLLTDTSWKQQKSLGLLLEEITKKQQEVVRRSQQALEQAIAERSEIAYELHQSRVGRQLKQQYTNPWAQVVARGYRINEKR